MTSDREQNIFIQILRFSLVGGFVYGIDFISFYFLTNFVEMSYIGSNSIAKFLGALVGFALHKYYTYSWRQANGIGDQFAKYAILFVANAFAANILLYFFAELSMPLLIGKLISDVVVICFSFAVSRHFIFNVDK